MPTVHKFDYDKLGRVIRDRVTALGSGVDDAVRRIETVYDVRGMPVSVTSYDDPAAGQGNVAQQVQMVYNDFGQLTAEFQAHDGPVDTMTTPNVEYAYADGTDNHIRPTSMTYPDGRVLTYDYGTTDGIDDVAGRVAALVDDDPQETSLVEYSYLGSGTPIEVHSPEPDIRYTLVGTAGGDDPDTGDIYRGLDRFGRVKDCQWFSDSSSTDVDRIQYGYDRAGNRSWRHNVVAASLNKDFDELYGYDGSHRLKEMQRGRLNGSKTALTTETFGQYWTLDETGNWTQFREDADGNSSWDLVQQRTANPVNEITGITNTTGPSWTTPAYNRAGNMITIPKPADPGEAFTATYDAWNRLVKLEEDDGQSGLQTVQENQYDGRRFRIVQKVYDEGTLAETRHYYYSQGWQVLEERLGNEPETADADRQFVWGLRYIDDLILRDRFGVQTEESSSGSESSSEVSSSSESFSGSESTPERLYALQDANWNVTAIADATGSIRERYAYHPYGDSDVLSSAFGPRTSSDYDWEYRFADSALDLRSRLQLNRQRYYHSPLGRWTSRDSEPYLDSMSLYAYARNNPIIYTDPLGSVVPIIPIVIGASCGACWGVAGTFFNTAHEICKSSDDEVSYLLCFASAIEEMQSSLDWYSWTVINSACWACGGGLVGAAKKIGQKMGSKWAAKRAAKEAREKARKQLLKKIAWCEAIHAGYKAAQDQTAGCTRLNDCAALKTKCIAAATEVAGRTQWLHHECDGICPGSQKRRGGPGSALAGHLIEVRERRTFAVRCCARMAAVCGADAINIPEIPRGVPGTPPVWSF